MSSVILEAHDLTKEYRHTVALDHIDLKIEKGKIYGFIGQNGAGKTTFLRLVTGLAFPTSGTLSLWGKTVEKELQEQRKRIGCMIETPALFPTMTAYQNMEIQRIQRGIPDKAVIQKTLAQEFVWRITAILRRTYKESEESSFLLNACKVDLEQAEVYRVRHKRFLIAYINIPANRLTKRT